ncbi:hypothetical protein [Actinopolyspora saharensis]|uniref:hypothetical protein n=1 Tax=Actinopolyspora saharensis TaxID=995062 RepID=UPI003F66D7E2
MAARAFDPIGPPSFWALAASRAASSAYCVPLAAARSPSSRIAGEVELAALACMVSAASFHLFGSPTVRGGSTSSRGRNCGVVAAPERGSASVAEAL